MYPSINSLRNAGILLGVGIGALIDGVFLQHIFQLHGVVSNVYSLTTMANLEINMYWGGIFHAAALFVTLLGLSQLWLTAKNENSSLNTKVIIGSLLLGWGVFNFVEGLINHHFFRIHHVVQDATGGTQLLWDLAFLVSGIVLMGFGAWLVETGKRELQTRPNTYVTFPKERAAS